MSRGTLRAVSVALLVGATLFLVFTPLQHTTQAQGGSIFYVAPNGNCGGVLPCFAHPQDAVDSANEGDVIKVAAGIYTDVSARSAPPWLSLSALRTRPPPPIGADPICQSDRHSSSGIRSQQMRYGRRPGKPPGSRRNAQIILTRVASILK
jgi:hypothetical protein